MNWTTEKCEELLDCPGGSGEQSAKQTSRKIKGRDPYRPPVPQMIAFIEKHREACRVEPTCRVLQIAPSTYCAHTTVARDPGKASNRSKEDAENLKTIKRAHDESRGRYGARKVWRKLSRKDGGSARCTVERLMRKQGLQGVSRGRKKTPIRPDHAPKIKPTASSRRTPRSTPGRRLHLCANRNGNGLRRFCHRHLRPKDCRMTRLDLNDDQLRPRRPQPSHLPTAPGDGIFDPPLGSRQAICVHSICQAARRS